MLLIPVGGAGEIQDLEPATLEHPEGAVSFLVLGDWGRRGGYHQDDVAEQMAHVAERTDAAFVVTTGDNFYPRGVDSVSDCHWQASYEDVYSADSLQVPWYPTLGNHDWRGDVEAQVAYSEESDRWHRPARYYGRRIPLDDGQHLRLVLLDTNTQVRLRGEDVPEGGGSRLRSYHGGPRSVWGTSRPGFLLVSVTSGEMVAQFVDHLGHVLHRAELESEEGGRCRESCAAAD